METNNENLNQSITTMDSTDKDQDSESCKLHRLALKIFGVLGLIIVITGSLLGLREFLMINLIWSCIIAGILGSTTSAFLSALQRKANGFEFNDGKKYPPDNTIKDIKDDKRAMFSKRMATFFLYRPTFGIIAGLIIFYGMQSGPFSISGIDNELKVLFYSLLSGLFVKSLIEKLKNLFDNLIGKK